MGDLAARPKRVRQDDHRAGPGRATPELRGITAVDVDRFLSNPVWSKATRATYHGAIRAWCLWLVRTKRREDDPTLIATPPRVPKRRPRPLADEHLAVLLSTRMHRRTRAMILLGAYAGMRVGEIAKIRGEDVDLITKSISVTGKGDKRRDVPMHPVLQILADYDSAEDGECRLPR